MTESTTTLNLLIKARIEVARLEKVLDGVVKRSVEALQENKWLELERVRLLRSLQEIAQLPAGAKESKAMAVMALRYGQENNRHAKGK